VRDCVCLSLVSTILHAFAKAWLGNSCPSVMKGISRRRLGRAVELVLSVLSVCLASAASCWRVRIDVLAEVLEEVTSLINSLTTLESLSSTTVAIVILKWTDPLKLSHPDHPWFEVRFYPPFRPGKDLNSNIIFPSTLVYIFSTLLLYLWEIASVCLLFSTILHAFAKAWRNSYPLVIKGISCRRLQKTW
jgi:hypothetical protein